MNNKLEQLTNRIYADKFLRKDDDAQASLKARYYAEGLIPDDDTWGEALDIVFDALVEAAEYREMYAD